MATNLSRDDELRGILSDITRHRFPSRHQLNPQSNLFLTAKYAVEEGYVTHATLDESESQSLATLDLTEATLTAAGVDKLAELNQLDQ